MLLQIIVSAIQDRDPNGLQIGLKDHLEQGDVDYLKEEMGLPEAIIIGYQNALTLKKIDAANLNQEDKQSLEYLKENSDINAIGSNGNPETNWRGAPIHAAAATGCVDLVKLLIEAGADVNQPLPNRSAPQDWDLPSKAPLQSTDGDTALHIAASKNMQYMAPRSPKEKNEFGFFKQPDAHFRVGKDKDEYSLIIKALLEAGANPDLTNANEKTPREIAEQFKHDDLVAVFDEFANRATKTVN